jgi:RHS repeat-associated protein
LPSGAVVKYSYRADGRVVSIKINGVTIVSEVDYFPFGEVKSWKYSGNNSYVRVFDSDGRIKEHTSAPGVRTLAFDPASRITGLTDQPAAANDWAFGYDKLDRLITANNAATGTNSIAQLKLGWTFDATSNRKTESRAIGSATPVVTNLTIDPTSNKLAQVASVTRSYDAAGNTINDGSIQSLYSARNRLMQVNKAGVQANYAYNAFGERVSKSVSGASTEFVYDEEGHLLGEYRAADSTELVWLGDTPLAVIKPSGSPQGGMVAGTAKVYFVQPDHLDTPRVIVNAANQPVWSWNSAPFGDTAANEQPTVSLASFQFNLRFPGQQFDAETGSHYNYFRDYEAGTGRYLQSDPIGLIAGLGVFSYVENQPQAGVDKRGLAPSGSKPPTWVPPGAPYHPPVTPKSPSQMKPPGDCTKKQLKGLQDNVNRYCKNSGALSTPSLGRKNCRALKKCIMYRRFVNNRCFRGGDPGHNTVIDGLENALRNYSCC